MSSYMATDTGNAHNLPLAESAYNPEWTPTGIEAAVDSNTLPWIPFSSQALTYNSGASCTGFGPGVACKPLRASDETGAFTMLVKLDEGVELQNLVHLGAADLYVLDGKLQYGKGSSVASSEDKVLTPAYWGYIPAMSKAKSMKALEKTELLMTFHGPVVFLDSSDKIGGLFTATDLKCLAKENGVTLLPQTLADALEEPSEADRKTAAGEKLAFSCNADKKKSINDCLKADGGSLSGITEMDPHFVDTRLLPWIVQGEDPKTCVSLKVVRVSPETGFVTAIVRQNGQAPPHYHLGAADFFITSGRIGYRAGPTDGYGPGVYMFEPAGARHEATQGLGDEDLIYTANIYGPIQFDSGVGTPPLAVLSWMTYLQFAKDSSTPLIRNRLDGSYLAAPVPPRFADDWFRKFDKPTRGFIDAKGNANRLPLRLESTNVFLYGTADADKMWKEFEDEPFEPVRVGGKAVVNIWFNNFTDTDCGGEYFETWYNTFVTAKGEPLELPMESPMSLIINDPKVKIYLMRVVCGDTPRNPGAAEKAITGGRAVWGFPKHPIPGKLKYEYSADKKNMSFSATHLDKKVVKLSVRLPEADEGAISIPMDIMSGEDTCIGAPMNGGTHKNDNGAHQTRYGMAFASTHHFKFWDAKTDSIEFGVDDHYAAPINKWGFEPLLKAHTSNMKIAAMEPCQWISADEVAKLVAEQDKLGAIGGTAKTQLKFQVPTV